MPKLLLTLGTQSNRQSSSQKNASLQKSRRVPTVIQKKSKRNLKKDLVFIEGYIKFMYRKNNI